MAKRKRDDFEENDTGERKSRSQALRLQTKFDHGSHLLHRALKTARGFERQKLGRRQKTARQKNEESQLRRLEQEVQALKVCFLSYLWLDW